MSAVTEQFLLNFCSPEKNRNLSGARIDNGRTYVSDGRIWVVVHEAIPLTKEAPETFPLKTILTEIIPAAEPIGSQIAVCELGPVPHVVCHRCSGTGKLTTIPCPCCKGEGHIIPLCDHCGTLLDEIECHNCQGDGIIKDPRKDRPQEPCQYCDGHGAVIDEGYKVRVGNSYNIAGKMLRLLHLLPGCQIPAAGEPFQVKHGTWEHGDVYFAPSRGS